jgi:hypothetical protein
MIRLLALACLLALAVIFWPGIKFAASSAFRDPIARNSSAETHVPRTWSSLADEKAIAAFTPCWTVFCKKIRSSMEIRVQPAFLGREDAWLLRTQQTMKILTSTAPTVTALDSPAGKIKCIESPDETKSACITFGSGLIGAFKGSSSDLDAFHKTLQSARIPNRK